MARPLGTYNKGAFECDGVQFSAKQVKWITDTATGSQKEAKSMGSTHGEVVRKIGLATGRRIAVALRGTDRNPAVEILMERKDDLLNNFGYGAFQDGLTRQKIEEIDAAIDRAEGRTS